MQTIFSDFGSWTLTPIGRFGFDGSDNFTMFLKLSNGTVVQQVIPQFVFCAIPHNSSADVVHVNSIQNSKKKNQRDITELSIFEKRQQTISHILSSIPKNPARSAPDISNVTHPESVPQTGRKEKRQMPPTVLEM